MSPLAWAWQKHNLAGMGPLLSSPGQATLGTADQGPAGMAGVSCPVLFPSKDRVRVAAQRPCQVVAGGGLAVTLWAAQENWVQGPRLLTAPLSLLIALLPAGPGPRVSREALGATGRAEQLGEGPGAEGHLLPQCPAGLPWPSNSVQMRRPISTTWLPPLLVPKAWLGACLQEEGEAPQTLPQLACRLCMTYQLTLRGCTHSWPPTPVSWGDGPSLASWFPANALGQSSPSAL